MGKERIRTWQKNDSNLQFIGRWSSLHLSAAWQGVMGLEDCLSYVWA